MYPIIFGHDTLALTKKIVGLLTIHNRDVSMSEHQVSSNGCESPAVFSSLQQFKDYIIKSFFESNISTDLIDSSLVFHSSLEFDISGECSTPIHEYLNWHYSRFGHQHQSNFYAAFLMQESGDVWQAIISCDSSEGKNGKPYKYLAPRKIGDVLYTPPVPQSIRDKVSELYGVEVPSVSDGSFWDWVKSSTEIELDVTEGGKKSLRSLSEGVVSVSLYGCTCGTERQDSDNSWNRKTFVLKDTFSGFDFADRGVVISLDKDTKASAKKAVRIATRALRDAFENASAVTAVRKWRVRSGKGVDDIPQKVFHESWEDALLQLEKEFEKRESAQRGKKRKLLSANEYAQKISDYYQGGLVWNSEHRCWRVYDAGSGVWKFAHEDRISEMVLANLRAKTDGVFGKRLVDDVRGLVSYGLITHQWKERQGILPFQDGVVDIATGNFESHSPANYLTWVLPRAYNTDADDVGNGGNGGWDNIWRWLNEAWQPSDVEKLLCFAAAVIRKRYDLHRFLYLIGTGGSGKGTFTRLLESVVGDRNIWTGRIQNLENENHCARLLGKVLAVFSDQDKVTGTLQPFKMLTGGDTLSGKHLYKDSFDFKYEGMCIVTANDNTFISAARWLERRAIVVECNYKPKRQVNLDNLFADEISAFTKYLLSIPDSEIDRVLSVSADDVNEQYLQIARADSVMAWLQDCVVYTANPETYTLVGAKDNPHYRPGDPITFKFDAASLWGNYNLYCHDSNLHPKGKDNFVNLLLEHCGSLGWSLVVKHRFTKGIGIKCITLKRDDQLSTFFDGGGDNINTYPQSDCQGRQNDVPLVLHSGNNVPSSDIVTNQTLHDVGCIRNVGHDVGLNPLPCKGDVGYVGFLGKKVPPKNIGKKNSQIDNEGKTYVENDNGRKKEHVYRINNGGTSLHPQLHPIDETQPQQGIDLDVGGLHCPTSSYIPLHPQTISNEGCDPTVVVPEAHVTQMGSQGNVMDSSQSEDNLEDKNNGSFAEGCESIPPLSAETCIHPYYKKGDHVRIYPTDTHWKNGWVAWCSIKEIEYKWAKNARGYMFAGCTVSWNYKGEERTAYVSGGCVDWLSPVI